MRPALDRLLARVAVVADLDAARALVRALPDCTAVTADGDVLAPGSARGGSSSAPSLLQVQAAVDEAGDATTAAGHRLDQTRFALVAARERAAAALERVEAALEEPARVRRRARRRRRAPRCARRRRPLGPRRGRAAADVVRAGRAGRRDRPRGAGRARAAAGGRAVRAVRRRGRQHRRARPARRRGRCGTSRRDRGAAAPAHRRGAGACPGGSGREPRARRPRRAGRPRAGRRPPRAPPPRGRRRPRRPGSAPRTCSSLVAGSLDAAAAERDTAEAGRVERDREPRSCARGCAAWRTSLREAHRLGAQGRGGPHAAAAADRAACRPVPSTSLGIDPDVLVDEYGPHQARAAVAAGARRPRARRAAAADRLRSRGAGEAAAQGRAGAVAAGQGEPARAGGVRGARGAAQVPDRAGSPTSAAARPTCSTSSRRSTSACRRCSPPPTPTPPRSSSGCSPGCSPAARAGCCSPTPTTCWPPASRSRPARRARRSSGCRCCRVASAR
nr:hypothetical protein [Angustibacter aerolatus]